MKNKLLSVVIPAYNIDSYLSDSVQSLGAFLNAEEVEILIINDGSTDNTQAIGKRLESKYFNVRLFNKPNGGLSSARNFGMDVLNGKYVYFFDGDDQLNAAYTSILMDMLKTEDLDLLGFGYAKVSDDGDILSEHILDSQQTMSKLSRSEFIKAIVSRDDEPVAGYIWTKIFKVSLLMNIRFRNMNYEDMPFVFDVLEQHDIKISYINNIVYYYIQRSGSITHSVNEKNILDKVSNLKIVSSIIRSLNVDANTITANNRRTLVGILWQASLNSREVKSEKVENEIHDQLRTLVRYFNHHGGIDLYLRLKMYFYYFKGRNNGK